MVVMAGLLLACMLAMLVGGFISWRLVFKISEQKRFVELASLRSRLRYQQASLNTYTIVENFTCGWLNLIIKTLWPGFILNVSNNLASRLLRNLFQRLTRNFANSSVMKHLADLELAEFSLGCMPPTFANAAARVHPGEAALELEFDVCYESCGAHLVVDTLLDLSGQRWPIQLVLGKFVLRGRLLLQLHLSRTATAGISGAQFAFVQKPHVDFEILSRGITLTQVPGVLSQLRRGLLNVIMNEAVEPARVWVNLEQPFFNLVSRKQSGKKGQLQVTIAQATDLKPLSDGELSMRQVELCMSFVELHVNGRIYTTPIAPQSNTPAWSWSVYLPVDRTPTSDPDLVLKFCVCNFVSDAQPQVIGSAEFRVASLELDEIVRSEPYAARIKLKAPKGTKGGGGSLHIALSYKQGYAHGEQQEERSEGGKPSAGSPRTKLSSRLQQVPEGSEANSLEIDDLEGGPRAVFGAKAGTDLVAAAETDSVGGRSGFSQGDDWMSVTAMTKIEKQLKLDAKNHSMEIASWRSKVEQLERGLQLEMERRYHQELRALVEGAEFIMYRGKDMSNRLVWYNPATSSSPASIRFEGGNPLPRVARAQKSRAKRKEHYHELDAGNIINVTYGFGHFRDDVEAHMEKRGLGRIFGKSKERSKSDRCFSVLFSHNSSKFPALHLEVPEDGNNRSRNEWVSAFGSLMLGYI